MEMKEVLYREGRDAKNLLVYQFCTEPPAEGANLEKTSPNAFRKPPKSPNSLNTHNTPKHVAASPTRLKQTAGPRVRSASTGRDKRSELQARYWALLFGNLQRAVNEIYQTVECYENISSCQEAILVLENYVRDFKALSEWFKVSWDYESRPIQQRPTSLAWEVRKSNPAPRVRAKSLSSPGVSGKSSPCHCHCISGKSSPCCGPDAMSPRKGLRDMLPRNAMRVHVRELFASCKRPPSELQQQTPISNTPEPQKQLALETEANQQIEKRHQYAQTDLEDDHLTLADIREKMRREEEERQVAERAEIAAAEAEAAAAEEEEKAKQKEAEQQKSNLIEETMDTNTPAIESKTQSPESNANVLLLREPTAIELTLQKLNAMEDAILAKDASKAPTPQTAEVKKIESFPEPKNPEPSAQHVENIKKTPTTGTPTSVAGSQNSPLKYSSVLNRPAAPRATPKTPVNTQRPFIVSTAPVSNHRPNVSLAKPSTNTGLRRSATTAAVAAKQQPALRTATRNGVGGGTNNGPVPPRPSSKTEFYGPPTNVATRLSARSRTMMEMKSGNGTAAAKVSTARAQLSRLTGGASSIATSSRKSSREDIGSSSSTLKASNERISSSRSSLTQAATVDERRSEPKQLPSDANDGWHTVKNRRRSSMHWANRFNQPTGYASLPTLALLNEKRVEEEEQVTSNTAATTEVADTKKQEKSTKHTKDAEKSSTKVALRPEIKNAKAKVNSLPASRKNTTAPATAAATASTKQTNSTAPTSARGALTMPSRQTIIKRQKSDVTGLKMTTLHKEYMRSEKNALRKQNNNNSNSKSAEAISTKEGCSTGTSSVETVIEANNQVIINSNTPDSESTEQHKIDIKIQTNRDFSKTIGDLYESIASTAKSAGRAERYINGNGTLSSCDESEETLVSEIECDEDQRMLVMEQESLERQIRELQNSEIDVDTETDETDCEVVPENEQESDLGDALTDKILDDVSSVVFVPVNGEEDDGNLSLELRYQSLLSEMPLLERDEVLATLQAYVSRHPGRAQELHQKLSSPSRRRSLQETLKKYQAKQTRAQQKRELLQKEKAVKIQHLLARVEDVKAAKRQLIEEKRLKMEGRLQRAAENREQILRQKIEKAHDEEKKLKEINFIKNIEAQVKRLDMIESSKETEGRLQDLEQERQKRVEEKAAKEAAVERRRLELEQQRLRKLEKMNETRLEKEQRIGKMQEQKERERQALAREKARDREERLLALQVHAQQTKEELQHKILLKQKESARRHEENMEHIRQRAVELTLPLRNVDENGQQHDENGEDFLVGEDGDLSSTVSDVGSREHTRGYKKKMKKLKLRMSQCAEEYMKELQPVPAHMKRESQVPKFLNLISKGGGAQGLERPLGQLLRLIAKAQVFDFQCFLLMDGLGNITQNVISKGMQEDSEVSKKAVVLAVQLYRNACTLCPQIARHALLSNSIIALFDALFQSLQLPEEKSPQHPVELSTELMLACTVALSPSYSKKHTHPKVLERLPDLISYAVITGLIEILSRRCMKIRESIENHQSVVLSLLATLGFLTRFIDICPPGPTDTTRFLSAAKSTELFGSISMLNASVVPIGECIPPRTVSLAAATFNLLVSMAVLDLNTFQDVMSGEALSLKFLDVATILLKYCGSKCSAAKNSETQAVIIDLIATLGFYCANNKKHQDLLTTEQWSIIIKSLTKLPEHLNVVVYPCLVTITFQNQNARNVIARDFNLDFLDEYSKSEKAKKNHLIALLKDKT